MQGGVQRITGEEWLSRWGVERRPPGADACGEEERDAVVRRVVRQKVDEDWRSLREPQTMKNYQRAAKHFQRFLDVWGKEWGSVTPGDVLVYLSQWVPRRQMGEAAWAPSTFRGRVSDLSRVFELCGCNGAWEDATHRGNPVQSHLVTETVERYTRQARGQGYAPQSAPPVTPEGLSAMTGAAGDRVTAAVDAGLTRTALVQGRNRLLLVWQWASSRRGQDLLRLTWEQVRDAARGSLVADAWAAGHEVAGLYVSPQQTKNSGVRRPLTIHLERQPDRECCPVEALRRWWSLATTAGEAVSGPSFCAYSATAIPSGGGAALTSAGYSNQFKRLAQGQALSTTRAHGMRRGRLQHEHAGEVGEAALMRLADVRTPAVLQLYLDRARHLPVYG